MQEIVINKAIKLDYQSDEAYKRLRTNVQFAGDSVKVIAVTSCTPDEGKTSVSFHLAVSMAQSGKKVLFIDGDMRKSVLVGNYKITKANKGLTHYLAGQNTLEEVLSTTNIPMLHMIVAGPIPPNPAELLDGKRFNEMIATMKEVYDYIIIDTPPLGNVIDCAIMARVCDGVVMVIAADEVSYKLAQKVKEQLERSGSKVLGAILNKVKVSKRGYYQKYYGKNYYEQYYGQ